LFFQFSLFQALRRFLFPRDATSSRVPHRRLLRTLAFEFCLLIRPLVVVFSLEDRRLCCGMTSNRRFSFPPLSNTRPWGSSIPLQSCPSCARPLPPLTRPPLPLLRGSSRSLALPDMGLFFMFLQSVTPLYSFQTFLSPPPPLSDALS